MAERFFERDGWQAGPALHALIVGISAYPNLPATPDLLKPEHFGMIQLASPALTAFRIATLLKERALQFDVPVATIRVLLAPSAVELEKEPAIAGFDPPDFLNFSREAKAWRADANASAQGMTLFYFAGHGLKRPQKRDHVLVLHNFNDGVGGSLFGKGIVVTDLFDGMAPSAGQETIARTQLYFFDACAVQPDAFKENEIMKPGSLWDVAQVPGNDDRVQPAVFASKPGGLAFAKPGVETLFGGALVKCLAGGAGVAADETDPEGSDWVVSLGSLRATMRRFIDQANRDDEAAQETLAQNIDGDEIVLAHLDEPPEVVVSLRIDPDQAAALAHVSVIDVDDNPVRDLVPFAPNPLEAQMPAGILRIRAIVNPAGNELLPLLRRTFIIKPPTALALLQLARKA